MNNVLFGNGLIIQYGGDAYTNASIIARARRKVRSGDFPRHLYPPECAAALVAFHSEYASVVRGDYDDFTVATFEREALSDFKRRYEGRPPVSVEQMGLEDYFLLFELVYNRQGVGNPDRFHSRGCLRRMLLDAVYNEGAIQHVHKRFPQGLVEFLRKQDRILTTNYDRNLEVAADVDVVHLHGAFHVLGAEYDPDSIRHHLSEDLLDGEPLDPDYKHLFSSCIVSYVSALKTYAMGQSHLANQALTKFAAGYQTDPRLRQKIEEWPETDQLLRRLREAIKLKVQEPDLAHVEPYPRSAFEHLSGRLAIIGLSTRNDGHIFREIDENKKLSSVDFYFFDSREASEAEALLPNHPVRPRDVRSFWDESETPR